MRNIKIMAATFLLAFAPSVMAQTVQTVPPGNSFNFKKILTLLSTVTDWLFTILLMLAVIFIILAAYKYLTSRGEATKVSEAHRQVIFAAIAIGVAMLSKGVEYFVRQLLGVPGGGGGSDQWL